MSHLFGWFWSREFNCYEGSKRKSFLRIGKFSNGKRCSPILKLPLPRCLPVRHACAVARQAGVRTQTGERVARPPRLSEFRLAMAGRPGLAVLFIEAPCAVFRKTGLKLTLSRNSQADRNDSDRNNAVKKVLT